MIVIRRYTQAMKQEWDEFVLKSKNATFLFMRGYMDYHADRFHDHSLLFYHKNKLLALLPLSISPICNAEGLRAVSHGGLTYGGLIMGKECTVIKVCEVFEALKTYLREQGIKELIYKAVPHIYHKYPAEEDLYALNTVCHATLPSRNISSVIDMTQPYAWRKGKNANKVAAKREGVIVAETDNYAAFWPILEANLQNKYSKKPVHTLQEIELLHSRFPQNIKLLIAEKDGKVLSGAVLYLTDTCVHAQYLCSSEEGNKYHCNELVIGYILKNYSRKRYFDYGISADEGRYGLNENLVSSKEGYGCRGVMYDIYEIKICE